MTLITLNRLCRLKVSFLLAFILCSFISFSQLNIEDDNEIKFQELFFDGLTQKAIRNYATAVEKLMECNLLKPNQKAVVFELSKNYFNQYKLPEAIIFAKQALALDNKNIWILEHLVKCYNQDSNFDDAIVIQEKIAARFPKKQAKLVYLHMSNNNFKSALKVLHKMEREKLLNRSLREVKRSLENPKKKKKKVVKKVNNVNIRTAYENEKSYANLLALLKKLEKENNYKELLTFSEEGINHFPAQSLIYLMNAKAHNVSKNFKKAIQSLNNGFDFIFEDKDKALFFKQYVKAYNGLGDKSNSKKYNNKLK